MADRVGLVAAAAALGKNRKILQRWKARPGCPLASKDGKVDPDELRAWAQREGLLERTRGRPTSVESALAAADAAAPAAPDVQKAKEAVEQIEVSGDAAALLEALESDDRAALLRQGLGADGKVLKKLEAVGKARAALADAIKRELDNQARRRDLIPAGDVKRFWAAQVEVVKSHFQALPGKLGPRLAGKKVDECMATLEQELHALLKAFAVEAPR